MSGGEAKQSTNPALAPLALFSIIVFAVIRMGLIDTSDFNPNFNISWKAVGIFFACWVCLVVIGRVIYFNFYNKMLPWIGGIRPRATTQIKRHRFDLHARIQETPRGEYLLGIDGSNKPIRLSEVERSMHIQVIGAPGTGKTSSVLMPLIIQDIRAGKGGIILEPKGDAVLVQDVLKIAEKYGRRDDVRIFSLAHPDKSVGFNPFQALQGVDDAMSVADRVFEELGMEHPYYGPQGRQLLRIILAVLEAQGMRADVNDITRYIEDPDALDSLIDRNVKSEAVDTFRRHREQLGRDFGKTFSGLSVGLSMFCPPGARRTLFRDEGISLLDAANKKQICIFHLPVGLYPVLARAVGRMVLRQVAAIGGARDAFPDKLDQTPFFCTVDECHVFLSEQLAEALAMLRSSKIQFTLAHQDLGQLQNISDAFERSIRSNARTKIILAPRDAEHAEQISKSFGTHTEYENTFRFKRGWMGTHINTGDASLREVQVFNVHPDMLKGLDPIGQGAVVRPSGVMLVNLEPYKTAEATRG